MWGLFPVFPSCFAGSGSGDFFDVVGERLGDDEQAGLVAPCVQELLVQGRHSRHLGQVSEGGAQIVVVTEEAQGCAGVCWLPVWERQGKS